MLLTDEQGEAISATSEDLRGTGLGLRLIRFLFFFLFLELARLAATSEGAMAGGSRAAARWQVFSPT